MSLYFNQNRTTKPCKTIFESYQKQFNSKSSSCKNLYSQTPSTNANLGKDSTFTFSHKNKSKEFQFSSPPQASISNKRKGNNILIANDIISSPHISKEIKKKFSKVLNDTLSITHEEKGNSKYHNGYSSQLNKLDKLQVKNKDVMSVLNKSSGFFYETNILNNITANTINNNSNNKYNNYHHQDIDFTPNHNKKNIFYDKLMNNKHHNGNANNIFQPIKSHNSKKSTLTYISNNSSNTSFNHNNYYHENSQLNMKINSCKTNGSYNRLSSLPSTKKKIQLTEYIPKFSSIPNYNYITPPQGHLFKKVPIRDINNHNISYNTYKAQSKEIKKSISQKSFVNGIEIKDNTRNDVITFRKIEFTNGSKTNSDNGSSYHNSREKEASVDKQSSFLNLQCDTNNKTQSKKSFFSDY